MHFCIKDPVLSKTAVLDLNHSLRMLAQTTLFHSLSSKKLVEVQNDRKFINKQVQVAGKAVYKLKSAVLLATFVAFVVLDIVPCLCHALHDKCFMITTRNCGFLPCGMFLPATFSLAFVVVFYIKC